MQNIYYTRINDNRKLLIMAAPHNLYKLLLQTIDDNHPGAVLFQKEQVSSEATSFILKAFLRESRRQKGALNRSDTLDMNAEIVKELRYIAEHNYIFFLTLIQRYDLIRNIFFDKRLFAKELAILRDIEREDAIHHRQYENEVLLAYKKLHDHAVVASQPPVELGWGLHFTNMDLFYYYHLEIQRITDEHHQRQVDVYVSSYESTKLAVQDVRDAFLLDPEVSEDDKAIILNMINTYDNDIAHLKQRRTRQADGSIDRGALLSLHDDHRAIDKKFFADIDKMLEKYKNSVAITVVGERFQKIMLQKESLLLNNEVRFTKELTELSDHFERTRNASKLDVNNQLDDMIRLLSLSNMSHLTPEQLTLVNQSIENLRVLKEDINNSEDFERISQLLTDCANEVKKIEHLLPDIHKESFKTHAAQLDKMLVTPKATHALLKQKFQVVKAQSHEALEKPMANQEHIAAPLSPEMPVNVAIKASEPLPSIAEPEVPVDVLPHSALGNARSQKHFKQTLNNQWHIQQANTPQSIFTKSLTTILNLIETAELNAATYADQLLFDDLKERIALMQRCGDCQNISQEDINCLYDHLHNLKNSYETLEDTMPALGWVVQLSGKEVELANQMRGP